jgi:hypothetical protein
MNIFRKTGAILSLVDKSEPGGMQSIGRRMIDSGRLEPTWKSWAEGVFIHVLEGDFFALYSISSRTRTKADIQRDNEELELGRIVEYARFTFSTPPGK